MSLETTRKGISEILDLLYKGHWQVPNFQREFVWNMEQVKKLINSFIRSYPIGLITIWDQPQNNPHTESEPLKLGDGKPYKGYDEDPAVIQLILDGKQRLTTLAMVFGGFHVTDERRSYSGSWFIDIDAFSKDDEPNIVVYKKQREIQSEQLDNVATCIRKALIPFGEFEDLGEYLKNIHNSALYPEGEFPPTEVRDSRAKVLDDLWKTFAHFQIPVAAIPEKVDLGAVCEIFDVLNTTGTKVSTFDLIHNRLYSASTGQFNFRDQFREYQALPSFGLLCDDDRKEFLCQVVTGCYLLEEKPVKASKKDELIASIKGKDLIETPLQFFEEFESNIEKVDTYANNLFSEVLGGAAKLGEIPYPVQVVLYLSLRWNLELRPRPESYSLDELNRVFRAFFWRNTLTTRYDQGFLSQFATDLKALDGILQNNISNRGDKWTENVNGDLSSHFGSQYKAKSKDDIFELVTDGQTKGALAQGIAMLINASCKVDLVSREQLDRSTEEPGKRVQLHHLFPGQWCKDNQGNERYGILQDLEKTKIQNNFANLAPLTAKSNNAWKTKPLRRQSQAMN